MLSLCSAAALVLGLVSRVPAGSAQDAQSVYAKALPSVMTVNAVNRDGTKTIGTGFLALGDGLAVPAWHVVDAVKTVSVRFLDGEEFDSTGMVEQTLFTLAEPGERRGSTRPRRRPVRGTPRASRSMPTSNASSRSGSGAPASPPASV